MSGRGNFSNYNRGFTYGTRGRGGSRGSWRGNWSRGNPFQSGGRGRGTSTSNHQPPQPYQTTEPKSNNNQ
ncbi:hypothetical protein G6F38_013705 [Rhizopus arrhizus]|nr:hypothetical protein G6F38_013705 [Rhizopus arrhizus]